MRKLVTVAGLVATVVLVASLVSAANQKKVTSPMTVRVIEHAATDVVTDTGKKGDSAGDLLTWHNKIFDGANKKQVGHDEGFCTRLAPAQGIWECLWTTFLARGQITVQGPFYDTRNSVLSITGGTGAYKSDRGQMVLKSRNGGKEYDFIFQLT